jgi:hypothetical protein
MKGALQKESFSARSVVVVHLLCVGFNRRRLLVVQILECWWMYQSLSLSSPQRRQLIGNRSWRQLSLTMELNILP